MTWLLFIGKILFVLLAIWGLVSLGHTVVRWMLRSVSQKERDFFLVVCVQGHDEEIEYLLRQLFPTIRGTGSLQDGTRSFASIGEWIRKLELSVKKWRSNIR